MVKTLDERLNSLAGKEEILRAKLTELDEKAAKFGTDSNKLVEECRAQYDKLEPIKTEVKDVEMSLSASIDTAKGQNEEMVNAQLIRFDKHCDQKIRELEQQAGTEIVSLKNQLAGVDGRITALQGAVATVQTSGNSGGSRHEERLCDRKDMELKDLPDGIDREGFIFWRKRSGSRMAAIPN